MTIITLTTDFGQVDEYVGTMKGVILGLAPEARLVDLSHEVAPQNIHQAAYVLSRAAPYFPAGTIHVAVVDPGVGGARRPLLVTTPSALYVGPDNGLFTFVLDQSRSAARVLDRREFWLQRVSDTFHGRDIFAPVAGHLATGVSPDLLSSVIPDPVRAPASIARREGNDRIVGSVVHVDRFGNLISDIPAAWLVGAQWICRVAGHDLPGVSETYSAVPPGTPLCLVSSDGNLEIAVRDGSAARTLGAGPDATVELRRKGALNGEVRHRGPAPHRG